MPSTSFKGLADRLKDVDQLMAAHTKVAGKKRGRKYEVEGLNRAAVLMLSAHFEGYLEDVMREALLAVNAKLNPGAVVYGFHNPWPHKIDELFATLGMNKPSKNVKWQKAKNSEVLKNLRELVATRNKVAHGTTGVKVYKADITRFRRYVEGFAQRFDAAVRTQVHTLTGKHPWPA